MKTGNYVQAIGKYNATKPTISDTAFEEVQLNSTGSMETAEESCTMTVVDTSNNTIEVTASPALLLAIYVNTVLSAHTVLIKDDTTTKIILPSEMAAGTMIDCHSAKFSTDIQIDPDDSSTGEIVIFWRAL